MVNNNNRLAYEGKIEAYLKEWGSQIDRWQEESEPQFIEKLNRKRQVVRRMLAEMREANDDDWQTLSADVDEAIQAMESAISEAREHFPQS